MRILEDVIDEMLLAIPEKEGKLLKQLIGVKFNNRFRPPELQYIGWQEGAEALVEQFGDVDPDTDWGKKVQAIWIGEKQKE